MILRFLFLNLLSLYIFLTHIFLACSRPRVDDEDGILAQQQHKNYPALPLQERVYGLRQNITHGPISPLGKISKIHSPSIMPEIHPPGLFPKAHNWWEVYYNAETLPQKSVHHKTRKEKKRRRRPTTTKSSMAPIPPPTTTPRNDYHKVIFRKISDRWGPVLPNEQNELTGNFLTQTIDYISESGSKNASSSQDTQTIPYESTSEFIPFIKNEITQKPDEKILASGYKILNGEGGNTRRVPIYKTHNGSRIFTSHNPNDPIGKNKAPKIIDPMEDTLKILPSSSAPNMALHPQSNMIPKQEHKLPDIFPNRPDFSGIIPLVNGLENPLTFEHPQHKTSLEEQQKVLTLQEHPIPRLPMNLSSSYQAGINAQKWSNNSEIASLVDSLEDLSSFPKTESFHVEDPQILPQTLKKEIKRELLEEILKELNNATESYPRDFERKWEIPSNFLTHRQPSRTDSDAKIFSSRQSSRLSHLPRLETPPFMDVRLPKHRIEDAQDILGMRPLIDIRRSPQHGQQPLLPISPKILTDLEQEVHDLENQLKMVQSGQEMPKKSTSVFLELQETTTMPMDKFYGTLQEFEPNEKVSNDMHENTDLDLQPQKSATTFLEDPQTSKAPIDNFYEPLQAYEPSAKTSKGQPDQELYNINPRLPEKVFPAYSDSNKQLEKVTIRGNHENLMASYGNIYKTITSKPQVHAGVAKIVPENRPYPEKIIPDSHKIKSSKHRSKIPRTTIRPELKLYEDFDMLDTRKVQGPSISVQNFGARTNHGHIIDDAREGSKKSHGILLHDGEAGEVPQEKPHLKNLQVKYEHLPVKAFDQDLKKVSINTTGIRRKPKFANARRFLSTNLDIGHPHPKITTLTLNENSSQIRRREPKKYVTNQRIEQPTLLPSDLSLKSDMNTWNEPIQEPKLENFMANVGVPSLDDFLPPYEEIDQKEKTITINKISKTAVKNVPSLASTVVDTQEPNFEDFLQEKHEFSDWIPKLDDILPPYAEVGQSDAKTTTQKVDMYQQKVLTSPKILEIPPNKTIYEEWASDGPQLSNRNVKLDRNPHPRTHATTPTTLDPSGYKNLLKPLIAPSNKAIVHKLPLEDTNFSGTTPTIGNILSPYQKVGKNQPMNSSRHLPMTVPTPSAIESLEPKNDELMSEYPNFSEYTPKLDDFLPLYEENVQNKSINDENFHPGKPPSPKYSTDQQKFPLDSSFSDILPTNFNFPPGFQLDDDFPKMDDILPSFDDTPSVASTQDSDKEKSSSLITNLADFVSLPNCEIKHVKNCPKQCTKMTPSGDLCLPPMDSTDGCLYSRYCCCPV